MSTATYDNAALATASAHDATGPAMPGQFTPEQSSQQTAPQQSTLHTSLREIVPSDTARADSETRVYRGRTVDELIPKIQAELGADAIVVRREKGLTGGFAGFFQRPFVEIEAKAGTPRVDRYDAADAAPALPPALAASPVSQPAALREAPPLDAGSPAQAEFRELTPTSLLQRLAPRNGSHEASALQVGEAFASTMPPRELETFGAAAPGRDGDPFAAALAEAEAAVPEAALPEAAVPEAAVPETDVRTDTMEIPRRTAASPVAPRGRARAQIEESLLGAGIGEQLMRELIETAAAHVLPLMPARSSLARAVHRTIAQRIPSATPLPVGNATIALVGPGGSGKTACCAALLDAYRERSTLAAACATVLPGAARGELEVLLSPALLEPTPVAAPQVVQALSAARDEGLLLLDLPALSPADRGSIRAFAALLGSLQPDRVIVALPATLGAKPARQLLESLRPLGASALAITHADETDQLGVAVEAACAFGLAPEYLLDRGRGRGGLIQVDPAYLADRLLP